MKKSDRNKKIFLLACMMMFLTGTILGGCKKTLDSDARPIYSTRLNYYQNEYEEQYNESKKLIDISDDTLQVLLKSAVTEGTLEIEVYSPNGESQGIYTVDSSIEEKIEYGKNYGEWKFLIRINPETEGYAMIEVYE